MKIIETWQTSGNNIKRIGKNHWHLMKEKKIKSISNNFTQVKPIFTVFGYIPKGTNVLHKLFLQ